MVTLPYRCQLAIQGHQTFRKARGCSTNFHHLSVLRTRDYGPRRRRDHATTSLHHNAWSESDGFLLFGSVVMFFPRLAVGMGWLPRRSTSRTNKESAHSFESTCCFDHRPPPSKPPEREKVTRREETRKGMLGRAVVTEKITPNCLKNLLLPRVLLHTFHL